MPRGHKPIDISIRFFEKVKISTSNPMWNGTTCWIWKASKNDKGYGGIGYQGKVVRSHRLAYEMLIGDIPDGLELDHLCRRRDCVNPFHLEPVTHKVNMSRGKAASKTHCLRGHPLSGSNVGINSVIKTRYCKTCKSINGNKRCYK